MYLRISWFIVFVFLSCYLTPLLGNERDYINYTTAAGLPSDECYGILQDSKGYIWITSDKGVSRYNGYEFQNFTTADGLSDNTIFEIFEDDKGRIWFGGLNGKLCFYHNNEFHEYKYNQKITEDGSILQNIAVSPNNTVELRHKNLDVVQIDSTGQVSKFKLFKNQAPIFSSSIDSLIGVFKGRSALWEFKDFGDAQVFSYSNVLLSNNLGQVDIRTFSNQIASIKRYEDKLMLPGTNEFIVYDIFKNEMVETIAVKESTFINSIQDHQGNIWVTNNKKGVYKLSYSSFSKTEGDPDITELISLDTRLSNPFKVSDFVDSIPFRSFRFYDHKWMVYQSLDFDDVNTHRVRSFCVDTSLQSIWVAWSEVISKVALENDSCIKLYNGLSLKLSAIHQTKTGKVWVGSNTGLYSIDNDSLRSEASIHPLLKDRIQDINSLKNGTVIIATRGNGLLIIEEDRIEVLDKSSGLLSNLINQIFVDEENNLWVATNEGVNAISFDSEEGVKISTEVLYASNYKSSDVFQVCMVDSLLYLSFVSDIDVLDMGKLRLRKQQSLPLYIKSITTSKGKLDQGKSLDTKIPYYDDLLVLSYEALSFNFEGGLLYRYKMHGFDKEWQTTKNREARYSNMPHGEYLFKVQVENENGEWSPAQSFSFEKGQAFWTTWWFIMLSTILLAVLAIWLAYWYYQNRKRKQQLLSQLQGLEQLALNARMNPHFIFNSLNAIQDFILRNDRIKASDFLGQFSKLIRYSFENNKTPTIPLDDEIKTLDQYLKLEQLRFENRFSYTFEIDEKINTQKCQLPSLLVQPYIENAIWHGILPLASEGWIKVSFVREGNSLKVNVQDNGIGREASKQVKKNNVLTKQKSSGIIMTKKRLKIINSLRKDKSFYKEENLYNDSINKGTSITFTIPYVEQ